MAKKRKNGARNITMATVAKEAGVSVVTVSRVINDHEYVAEDTKTHVLQVIDKLGYRPNAIARSLVSKETKTVGLITADLIDYFFSQTLSGAEEEARRQNYFCLLASTEGDLESEANYVRLFQERYVDGFFFVRPSTDVYDERLLKLLGNDLPIVTVGYHLPLDNVIVVDVDNVDGGRQATQHLADLRHRNIAVISGPKVYKSVEDRSKGYELVLETSNIPYNSDLIVESDWSYEGGYQAARTLLARKIKFSAIFAHSDEIAIGVMQALRDAGLSIPDDVSIVSYNNNPVTAYLNPGLTTINQEMRKLGVFGMQLLLRAIKGEKIEKREHLVGVELIERNSTKPYS